MPLQTNLSYFIILFSLISLSSSSQLTIGIIGDQTASNDLQKPYEILAEGVNILNKLSPNIIIHTGDLIESSLPPDQVSSLFNRAVSILNNLKMPWFLTPGDHDVNPPVFLPDSKDFSRKTLYHNLYIKYNKFLGKDDFYSFNVNGYHIIILDSLSHLHTDPRWGNVFLSQLGENQLRWLAKDLEEAKNAEGIVVFLHQPLWYNWSLWASVHSLLEKYNVLAVIAGHFHYYQDEGIIGGVHYLVVGVTGAGIKKNSNAEAGGKDHVTVISINDRQLHVSKVIPIDGTKEFEFPIRRDMDRVQALDQILGNLWNFGDINKIFVDGDHLTNICGSLTNIANLKLYLGNPLDIVVNLSIEVSSELAEIRLKEEKFANDACQSEFLRNNKVVCELKANNRVIIANTNSVNLDGGASPVWIGDLEENIGKISVIGQKIKFFVNFQFKNEEEREFSINKTVETVILGCSG